MEGINQFVSWRHIIEYMNNQFGTILDLLDSSDTTVAELYSGWNETIYDVLGNSDFTVTDTLVDSVFKAWSLFAPNSTATPDQLYNASVYILGELLETAFDGYDFEPPESDENLGLAAQYRAYNTLFELIFGYFFISAGLVLVSIGVLSWFSMLREPGRETRHRYVGIIGNFILGLGLTLLSTMLLTQAPGSLGDSAWVLPLLVFVLFIALLLNHIPRSMQKGSKE